MNYKEKLQDPRWQRKRLEILQRDNFKCVECGEDKKTLHVHHIKYNQDCEPWEYEDDNFQTLCSNCHNSKHYVKVSYNTKTFNINYVGEFDTKITEDNGFISVKQVLELFPKLKEYIAEIGNHKGDWDITPYDNIDWEEFEEYLHVLFGFAYFDCHFKINLRGFSTVYPNELINYEGENYTYGYNLQRKLRSQ